MKAMIAGCAKLIAGLLVVAVLSGAQCLNLCAISPCGEGSATRSLGPSGKSPCHHNRGSESQSPNKGESCTHQEFVAEKRLGERLPEFGILLTAPMQPLHSTLLEPSRLPAFVDSIVKVRLKRPTDSILRI